MAGRHARKQAAHPAKRARRNIIIASSVMACALLTAGTYYGLTRPLKHPQMETESIYVHVSVRPSPKSAERTNILLIGTDTRPNEPGGNTDVLVLCSVDRKHKRIEMMSIPRDTRTMYPDGSYAKINEGLSIGDPPLTEYLVQSLIQQPIDHYALTRFGGLVDIINTIGGITLNVPERMYYNTGDSRYRVINLQKGTQTLTGEQALGFVRFRHDALGDIGRTERQQQFLTALTQKLLQAQNIPKLPALIQEFWGTMDTDMNVLDVGALATHAEQYKDYKIITETLPGSFHDYNPNVPNDQSYWIVNPRQARYVAKQFFENGVVVNNPVQDLTVTDNWRPPAPGQSSNTAEQANDGDVPARHGTSHVQARGRANQTAIASLQAEFTAGMQLTATASAYVRSGPGRDYNVVASVLKGQPVWVVNRSGDWSEIVLDGERTGYIASWLLSP